MYRELHPSGLNPSQIPVALVEPQLLSEPRAQLSGTFRCLQGR